MIRAVDTAIERGAVGNGEALESSASRGVSGYSYGWPSGGTLEPDVAAQWLFDESSGDIVDEVGSVSVPVVGSPTYNVAAAGDWVNLSPGITFGAGKRFDKTTSIPAGWQSGTQDMVIEWVCNTENDGATWQHVSRAVNSGGGEVVSIYGRGGTATGFTVFIRYADNSWSNWAASYTSLVWGTTTGIHKFRLVFDRDGSMQLFFDGDSQGTSSISAHSAKDLDTITRLVLGAAANGAYPFLNTMYEYRWTIGNATSNSGGPNGG